MWPWTLHGLPRRIWPDLGLCQQPIDDVRDYFGEKVASYLAAPTPTPTLALILALTHTHTLTLTLLCPSYW